MWTSLFFCLRLQHKYAIHINFRRSVVQHFIRKMPKRKCILNPELQKKYPYIQKTISDSDVRCGLCQGTFNIGTSGKSEIERHIISDKHKKALTAASKTRTLTNFFPSKFDRKIAACEGVWAYHVVKANHSFASSDCASKIFRTCFEMRKFHCARSKCESIAINVLAPYSTNVIKAELEKCQFVCVSVDASNHGNVKLMPVVVRYFQPTIGVRVKMLQMSSEKGETSLIIENLIKKTTDAYQLNDKLVGFCGDNCATNFGSRERRGESNVYFRLKRWRPELIGVGCAAHIVHNALKSACDTMPFDVECIVVKIYSEFYIYTARVESLKAWCDEIENVEYSKLLGYAKTRFLALGPAINSILKVYEALQSYFLNLKRCPTIIKDFFENPFSKMWMYFIKSQVRSLISAMANCRLEYLLIFNSFFFQFACTG